MHQASVAPGACPITGLPGEKRRRREARELADSYRRFFGPALPEALVTKYFTEAIEEYQCEESGMRWYAPARLGASDYYETLASLYPWYYGGETWDKAQILGCLEALGCRTMLEFGCGDGAFLKRVKAAGMEGAGIEINEAAIRQAQGAGLKVYHPSQVPETLGAPDALCLLQTIEHVSDPVQFLADALEKHPASRVILSAPCFESLLGETDDPLAWPPHHFTSWSEQGFRSLAQAVGRRVAQVHHEPLDYRRLDETLKREQRRKLPGLPWIPPGVFGKLIWAWHKARGAHWATRAHSIVVVMER